MKCIKVMQVTDSLNAAGRERMAVNLANLLQRKGYRSYLCSTRSDGPLEDQVGTNVGRLRLARTYMVDFGALRRLIAFIRENQIDVLHAHGASLFIAGVASIFPPNPVVVWHDNDGNHGQKERPRWLYRLGATRVNAVITASEPLGEWSRTKLHVPAERVWYLPNFVQASERVEEPPELPGVKDSRIVCVAGLRRQKDHITLLRAMALVVQKFPKAHLLIVGGSSDAGYLEQIQKEIHDRELAQHVSLLGERHDIHEILQVCRMGVLSSASEALPLALLEYGVMGVPAVVTNVGQCAEVLDEGRAGLLVPPRSPERLAEAMSTLLQSPEQCALLGQKLKSRVQEKYGPEPFAEQISGIYETVLGSSKSAR